MCKSSFVVENLGIKVDFVVYTAMHPRLLKNRKTTFAFIRSLDNNKVIHTGMAFFNPKDRDLGLKFNEDFGKKLALTRAVELFPKDLRTEIWNTFMNKN